MEGGWAVQGTRGQVARQAVASVLLVAVLALGACTDGGGIKSTPSRDRDANAGSGGAAATVRGAVASARRALRTRDGAALCRGLARHARIALAAKGPGRCADALAALLARRGELRLERAELAWVKPRGGWATAVMRDPGGGLFLQPAVEDHGRWRLSTLDVEPSRRRP